MALSPNQSEELTSQQFIKSGLEDQVNAIVGYEGVIWKLRAGYLLVLNGVLALVLGRSDKALDICNQMTFSNLISVFSMIFGISFTFFFIDFVYVRKKLKFVVARELLINLACGTNFDVKDAKSKKQLKHILHIAGETRPRLLGYKGKPVYKDKRDWNLYRVLLPIYVAVPLLSIGTYFLCYLPYLPSILKSIWHWGTAA
jgi:hypothetical protein